MCQAKKVEFDRQEFKCLYARMITETRKLYHECYMYDDIISAMARSDSGPCNNPGAETKVRDENKP